MAWLLQPAPAARLAMLRILVGAYAVVWLIVRLPAHLNQTGRADSRWMPIGVLAPFDAAPPDAVIVVAAVATPILGMAFVLGWRYRATAPLFAVGLVVVTTLASSWGQIFHTENLLVLHVLVLAVSPAADALAIDRRRTNAATAGPRSCYGWPLKLAALVVVITYVIAGIAKLRLAGAAWSGGDVLRHLVAHDNLRKAVLGDAYSPVGTAMVAYGWLFPPLALATYVIELGAPLALVGRRLARIWVIAAWSFHAGVLVVMAILFPYPLAVVAFAPFFALERLVPRLVRLRDVTLRRVTSRRRRAPSGRGRRAAPRR